jgi:hypothetical protein
MDAGATARAMRTVGSGLAHLGRVGRFLVATNFDLAKLAALAGGLDPSAVESLTLRRTARWLFPDVALSSNRLCQRSSYHLCPACVESRLLPLSHMFRLMEVCTVHRLRLIGRCQGPQSAGACDAPIVLFASQEPFSCHECGSPYVDLPHIAASAGELTNAIALAAVYADLFAFVPPDRATHTPADLRQVLRYLLTIRRDAALNPIARGVQGGLLGRSVSLAAVVVVLANSVTGAAGLDERLRNPSVLRATDPGPDIGATCPNGAHCSGGSGVFRNGHFGGPAGPQEFLCKTCGTRWAGNRVLFSFDEQRDYVAWRARQNQDTLARLRVRLAVVSAQLRDRGEYATRERLFRLAGVPGGQAYHTPRAGLTAIALSGPRARYRS